ncbi:RNA/RNP complex-1-interacting phosphatase [Varanus komodoensis]|nr:RNA/RNP complex-1-interacting phosphatase [Varanus komodoensis]
MRRFSAAMGKAKTAVPDRSTVLMYPQIMRPSLLFLRGHAYTRAINDAFPPTPRWTDYLPLGKRIPGTRFIAFKVPLKKKFEWRLAPNERFSPSDLLDQVREQKEELGLIIDLTYTTRYYEPEELPDTVQYCKILTVGHEVPDNDTIFRFKSAVKKFLTENEHNDKLIGVHCTHGLNRTGYLVCSKMCFYCGRYLIDVEGMDPNTAIERENRSLPTSVRHSLTYLHVTNRSPPSLLFSRLKRPSSLSLASYGIPCNPATNLVALRYTDSNLAISFLQPYPNPSDRALVYPKTPQFLHQDIMGHFVKGLAEIQVYHIHCIPSIQPSQNLVIEFHKKSIGKKQGAVVKEPEAFLLAPHPKPVVRLGDPPVPAWPKSPDQLPGACCQRETKKLFSFTVFNRHRGHCIERKNYIEDLRRGLGRRNHGMPVPRCSWVKGQSGPIPNPGFEAAEYNSQHLRQFPREAPRHFPSKRGGGGGNKPHRNLHCTRNPNLITCYDNSQSYNPQHISAANVPQQRPGHRVSPNQGLFYSPYQQQLQEYRGPYFQNQNRYYPRQQGTYKIDRRPHPYP